MGQSFKVALGLDFGTESVRALLVTLDGVEVASTASRYRSGQITEALPTTGETLAPRFALQDPRDWIASARSAVRRAIRASGVSPNDVVGVGVGFTSCTMLPAYADGRPLCEDPDFADEPHAWPKLWKHHGAQEETDLINRVARRRKEPFLDRYGGTIGLEWFFPKLLEVINNAPHVNRAAEVWIEAGDWLVWRLTGCGTEPPRSTCQAGYKAMWSAEEGYPSTAFFRAVNPALAEAARHKMPGRLVPPGLAAGELSAAMARSLGLTAGTPVSSAIIDAHAGVAGVGAAGAGTLVMVMGTSSCHMLNSKHLRPVKGVAGVVRDGILPGYYGYETGQAAVGDAFDWLRRMFGQKNHDQLSAAAAQLAPGADGVLGMDWMNGCRTPLMDGTVAGAFTGLSMRHGPEHLYRALLEASAFGLRWIVDTLVQGGVPVRRCIATGGLPHHNPALMQIYADVLGRAIFVHPSDQGPALGAAVLGALAAGKKRTGFASASAAVRAMAVVTARGDAAAGRTVTPSNSTKRAYDRLYGEYRALADHLASNGETHGGS